MGKDFLQYGPPRNKANALAQFFCQPSDNFLSNPIDAPHVQVVWKHIILRSYNHKITGCFILFSYPFFSPLLPLPYTFLFFLNNQLDSTYPLLLYPQSFFFQVSKLCKFNSLPFNKFRSLLCILHMPCLWPKSKMSCPLLGHPCITHLNTMHTTPYIHKPNENLFNQL